jgi:hypothetical protein
MLCENMKSIARDGTIEDLYHLLKRWGDKGTTARDGRSCIDWMIEGVNECGNKELQAEKRSLIADYGAGAGIFTHTRFGDKPYKNGIRDIREKDQKIADKARLNFGMEKAAASPDELQEIRDTLSLLSENIATLVERVEKLERAQSAKAPPPGHQPWH